MNWTPPPSLEGNFLKATQLTALVYVPFLEAARDAAAWTTIMRREGAPPERKGNRARTSSVVLLALQIDALLRWAGRVGRPHHRPALIWKMLGVSRQMLSEAVKWLAERGVARGKGSFARWSIKVPCVKSEIGKDFVPIPEAAIYIRPFDFLVLALLHHFAECLVVPGKDKRIHIISITRYVPDAEEYLRHWYGKKAVRAALRRLAEGKFINMDDGVKLTPVEAIEHMRKRRGGADIWALVKAGKKPTKATFVQLRGEWKPTFTTGSMASAASSSSAGEVGAAPPVPAQSSKPPSSKSLSTFKPLRSAGAGSKNPLKLPGHGP
jgi:hypothetical protein